MLGGPAVGKSSLVSQFMTSEYLHAYDTSIGELPSSPVKSVVYILGSRGRTKKNKALAMFYVLFTLFVQSIHGVH